MAVKKQFQDLVNLLEANAEKKVKSIMDDVLALVETKSRGGSANTTHRDEKGNLVAIFDYYFKQWMPISHIEFGAKASSNTGFNSMCKEGVSNWTRQQNAAKKAESKLLNDAINGDVAPDQMKEIKEQIEADRISIVAHSTGIGFDNIEDLMEADTDELDRMVEAAQPDEEVEADTSEANDAEETEANDAEDQAQAA